MDRKSIHFRTDLLQIDPYIGRHFDIVHNIYCLRLRLLNGIQNGLKNSKGQSGFKIEMPITLGFLEWMIARLRTSTHDSIAFKYFRNQNGPKLRLVRPNGFLSLPSEKDFVKVDILNVAWLDEIVGQNWHMYPLLDHTATVANIATTMHAFIPELNSGVEIILDHETLALILSVKYVSKEVKSKLLEKRTDLWAMVREWKKDLQGLVVYDPEDQSYNKIVFVEQNFKDFVAKKGHKKPISCCVAWLLKFDTLEYVEDPNYEDKCKDDEETRLELCYPYEVHDVLETCLPIYDQGNIDPIFNIFGASF
jgi:hypothetical protein